MRPVPRTCESPDPRSCSRVLVCRCTSLRKARAPCCGPSSRRFCDSSSSPAAAMIGVRVFGMGIDYVCVCIAIGMVVYGVVTAASLHFGAWRAPNAIGGRSSRSRSGSSLPQRSLLRAVASFAQQHGSSEALARTSALHRPVDRGFGARSPAPVPPMTSGSAHSSRSPMRAPDARAGPRGAISPLGN